MSAYAPAARCGYILFRIDRMLRPSVVLQHATVGIYAGASTSRYSRRSEAHHALARSVSLFHSFLRPLGDALTEETVSEVAGLEENSVREELLAIYGNITVATKIYQLVSVYETQQYGIIILI